MSIVSRVKAALLSLRGLTPRGLAFGLIVATAFTLPFEFTKTWFPVSWIELSRVFMAGAMLVTGWAVVRSRSGLHVTVLLAAAALMIGVDVASRVVQPYAGTLKDLLAALVYFAFAVTVGWNVRHVRQIWVLALAVLASMAIVAAAAILEETFNFYLWYSGVLGVLGRRNSTLADPNNTARVLSLGLLVLLGLVASRRRWRWLPLACAAALAVALGVAEGLTQSRAMWFITAAALLVWIPVALSRRFTFVPMAAFAFGLVALLMISPSIGSRAATMIPAGPVATTPGPTAGNAGPVATTPGPTAGNAGIAPGPTAADVDSGLAYGPATPIDPLLAATPLDNVRLYLIRAGVAMWLANPVFGVGFSGFETAIRGPYWSYVPPDRRSDSPTVLPHTDAVRVLAETGLVGFAAYLLFLGAFALMAIRYLRQAGWRRAMRMALLTTFGIIVLASQFEGRFTDEPYLWLLVGVCLGLPAVHRGQRRGEPSGMSPNAIDLGGPKNAAARRGGRSVKRWLVGAGPAPRG
jgi:hypothetical protein